MTSTALPELTALQRRFVEALIDCPSAVEAYRRAGGHATSDESAFSQASRLMRNDKVRQALAEYKAARAELVIVDSAWIREQAVLVYNRCMQSVPILDSQGNETGVFKFDQAGANAAIRSLIMLEEKFPKPKNSPKDLAAAKERLKMYGIRTELPTEEDWAEVKRLGLRNIGELDDFKKGEAVRAKMRERGIDPDAPPAQPVQGSASTDPVRAAVAPAPNGSLNGSASKS